MIAEKLLAFFGDDRAKSSSGDTDGKTNTEESAAALIDWSHALEHTGGNAEILNEVVRAFLDEAPNTITAIRSAVENSDTDSLRLEAHKLRGSLRFFGVDAAYEQASRLETIGSEGDLENANALVDNLGELITHLLETLRTNSVVSIEGD